MEVIKIHKQLWYVVAPDREDSLAYMTHYEDNEAFNKRKSTGLGWASPSNTKWNPETRKHEVIDVKIPEEKIIDNLPIKGIYIGSSVSRWSTSNKLFRVKDPRGFTIEVPTDNIATLLHLTTVVNGVVQEECVWGRDGNNHILLPVNSEPYLETLDKMDTLANKLIKVSGLKVGDVVKFFENEKEYTFMGKAKPTWNIKPYESRYTSRCSWERTKEYLKEFEHTHSKYENVFTYTYTNYEGTETIYTTTESNPKIVEVVRNVSIDRSSVELPPSYRVCVNCFDHETLSIKWKE